VSCEIRSFFERPVTGRLLPSVPTAVVRESREGAEFPDERSQKAIFLDAAATGSLAVHSAMERYERQMSELGKLSFVERAMACRARAEELVEELERAPEPVADELRKLSRQWLLLAQQLEESVAQQISSPVTSRRTLRSSATGSFGSTPGQIHRA